MGRDRIEFTFKYRGKRYRPTVRRTPTAANLRRARVQLEAIKLRIEAGTFSFVEEFPDYRLQNNLAEAQAAKAALPTCGKIFDAYLAHCEMRVAMHDMAFSTCQNYQRLLDSVWRPQIGNETFEDVRYSRLGKL